MDLLVELTLTGRPLSLQTKNRHRLQTYKQTIENAATHKLLRAAHPGKEIFFSIGDFSWRRNQADADNIIKPAQDVVMVAIGANDRQVRDSLGFNCHSLGFLPFPPYGLLPALEAALLGPSEFIHIAVSAAADPHFEGVVDA